MKNKTLTILSFAAFLAISLFPNTSFSHAGRLNKDGCHVNKKTKEYHCHVKGDKKGDKSSVKKTSKIKR
ncbi:MAG: YHYH domain-containing protein [Proteobacteria bacterium]|nr:YHYH domain-containing protein [Pseudomonadota bacterium]